MKKRLIELDDELLAAARKELNTSGVSDTVRLAIQQAAALSARARQVEWLRGGGLLIDTNAAALAKHPRVADRIFTLIESGLAATTAQLDPEALHSAPNSADYELLWSDCGRAYEYPPTNDEHCGPPLMPSERRRHRAVGMADLLIGVLAAEHRLDLVHYDADFGIAEEVLPIRSRWVVERRSID